MLVVVADLFFIGIGMKILRASGWRHRQIRMTDRRACHRGRDRDRGRRHRRRRLGKSEKKNILVQLSFYLWSVKSVNLRGQGMACQQAGSSTTNLFS